MRLAILGGGAVVQECYLPALRMLGDPFDVTVIDLSKAALRKVRQQFPKVRIEQSDFHNLLAMGFFRQNLQDAAVVALPNWLHEEAVIGLLREGLHVLCEKPLALTSEACLRMADKADRSGRLLGVNMARRQLPSMTALAEGVSGGLIGNLISVDIEDGEPYAWGSDSGAFFKKENGGVLADMGVHFLDWIESFAGELVPLEYEDDWQGGVETHTLFRLESRGGIPVRLELSRTRRLRNTIVLKGDGGELIAYKNRFDRGFLKLKGKEAPEPLLAKNPFSNPTWPPTLESCFAQQLEDFLTAVEDGTAPSVSARRAASTMRLIEWAYQHRTQPSIANRNRPAAKCPPIEKDSVYVTGGTGFIGSNLVRRLFELGFERVSIAVRNFQSCAEVARFPVELKRVDLLDLKAVKTSMKGSRWVFHCAYGRDGPRAGRITVEGTRNVVEAAIAAGCESVVILSTAAVFGKPKGAPVDESYPYRPALGQYGQSKALMERWCLERARSCRSTRIAVLNPTCVYGPLGTAYSAMPIQLARVGTFCWVEGGCGLANYTYVENLLEAILLAAARKQAHGQRFIINDGTTSWRDFLLPLLGPWAQRVRSLTRQELLELHREARRIRWADWRMVFEGETSAIDLLKKYSLFQNVLQMAEQAFPCWIAEIRRIRRRQAGVEGSPSRSEMLPPLWLTDLFGPDSTVFSSEKAARVLGWRPRVDLAEGQRRTVTWLSAARLTA